MGKTKQAFLSAAHKCPSLARRFGLASVLALSLTPGMAQAQQNQAPVPGGYAQNYQPQDVAPVPQDLSTYLNNRADAPEVRALKTEFAKTNMGVALLRFARNHNINFVLDPALAARRHRAEYDPADGNVHIRPGLRLEGLVINAAHELRHGWQDKELGVMSLERGVLTPWQRWTLRRYMEADAESFAAYFEADRLHQGLHLGPGFSEAGPAALIAMRLRGLLDSPHGLDFGEYRQLAFEPALASLHDWDNDQLKFVEDMTLNFGHQVAAAQNDPAKRAALQAEAARAPGNAAFAGYLRHFGGVSLDPWKQTCLQSRAVTDDMLLNGYPRREDIPQIRSGFNPELDQKIAALTAQQNDYLRMLAGGTRAKPAPRPGS